MASPMDSKISSITYHLSYLLQKSLSDKTGFLHLRVVFRLTEKTRKKGDESDTDEGNTTASHKLLHTL
jgi:hypothetical protein